MAKVQGTFYTAERLRRGTSPVSPPYAEDEGQPYPINPPGSNVPSYITLSDTKDGNYLGKNGFVPVVTTENGLKLEPLPQVAENGLISGGIVQWSGVGYIFNVSGAFYRIGGVLYESPAVQITLDAPDATNNRIDVFAVDINSVALDITGTPDPSPVKPQIDPSTQLELTSVIVTAASTEPTLTEEVIYDENIEWTGSSTGTGTANFASAVDPYQGTVSVEVTNIQNAFYIEFDNGSTIDISGFQTLGFQLKLKSAMPANQNLIGILIDGSGNPASSSFSLSFDKLSTDYQFVGVVLSGLAIVEPNIRYLRIVYIRTSGSVTHSGYFLDILKMEGGINPPVTANNFLNLTDTPSSYVGQASKVVSVKADETGLEFTTVSGGGISGSGTANEIAYFTAPTAIASLPVATYPSLTELAYVKGVTSSIQTQLNALGSKWTLSGSDIYRNSKVTVGDTTIIDADFGIKQVDTDSALRIDSLARTTRRTVFSMYDGGSTLRYTQDNWGVSIWSLWSGSAESGSLAFTTPSTRIGILTASTRFFTAAERGEISWSPTATGATDLSLLLTSRNTSRITFGATGHFTIGNQSLSSTIFGIIKSTAVTNAFQVLDSSGNSNFLLSNTGDISYKDGGDFSLGTTTGTKIGTATTQKLSFWNKTPIIQPTTSITGATLVGGGGTTITDTDTFGGYTLQQIAAALINTGLLA